MVTHHHYDDDWWNTESEATVCLIYVLVLATCHARAFLMAGNAEMTFQQFIIARDSWHDPTEICFSSIGLIRTVVPSWQ